MKLIDCLNLLPDNLEMIDLSSTSKANKYKTVKDLKAIVNPLEDGYEIRRSQKNYGQTTMRSIGIIGGNNVFNERT
ncbi:hypothetical protein [Paenibacillus amylolyticus]|uniref:hypothetical protein n=1 Tax=Paenibacillus amylolyticus TaxID=1451 RepID=UPI00339B0E63